MNIYEELANEIIDSVCDVIAEHYDIEPKHITDDDSIENPSLINGTIYYDLESSITQKIENDVGDTSLYLVKNIEDDSIEGYVTSKEAFKQWLKRHNESREQQGEITEHETEFVLIEIHNLEVK